MSDKKIEVNNGIGFFGLLTIVFITLKLTGYIDWSWWMVTIFIWLPPLVVFLVFLAFMTTIHNLKRK